MVMENLGVIKRANSEGMFKSFRSGEGRGRKKRLSDMWYVAQKLESVLCHPGIFVTSAIKCEEEVIFF